MVWLSGSFPLSIYPDSSGETPFLQGSVYGESLKKAANLLAEAHVAVYPVDVRGVVTDPLFSAATNDLLAPLFQRVFLSFCARITSPSPSNSCLVSGKRI